MLIITNGSAATVAMDDAGIPGEKLSWDDVLHDGPVPAGLSLDDLSAVRARFIADRSWGSYEEVLAGFRQRDGRLRASNANDEVVLWFEHDLYDQLQLLQLLDWFRDPTDRLGWLSLICHDRFVSLQDAQRLRDDYAGRSPVTDAQLELGAAGWAAVRSPTPRAVMDLLEADLTPLPFLHEALERLLQELPGRDGLGRSERQILRAVADGATDLKAAFAATQALEEAPYLGDASFGYYVRRLSSGLMPLLREGAEGLALTELGRVVLDQREDWIRMAGLQRWLGGVRLCPESLWRWDSERRAIRLTVREPR